MKPARERWKVRVTEPESATAVWEHWDDRRLFAVCGVRRKR